MRSSIGYGDWWQLAVFENKSDLNIRFSCFVRVVLGLQVHCKSIADQIDAVLLDCAYTFVSLRRLQSAVQTIASS